MSDVIYYPHTIDPDSSHKREWFQGAVEWFLDPNKIKPVSEEQLSRVLFGVERQYDRTLTEAGVRGEFLRAWMEAASE